MSNVAEVIDEVKPFTRGEKNEFPARLQGIAFAEAPEQRPEMDAEPGGQSSPRN